MLPADLHVGRRTWREGNLPVGRLGEERLILLSRRTGISPFQAKDCVRLLSALPQSMFGQLYGHLQEQFAIIAGHRLEEFG